MRKSKMSTSLAQTHMVVTMPSMPLEKMTSLLLSSNFIQSTWFCQPEVTAWGTDHFAWAYLWFSQIHCKLNFIEQYWGAVKFHYCSFRNRLTSVEEMEIRIRVLECLNSVPLLQIRWWAFYFNLSIWTRLSIKNRYANRSVRFMDGYAKGLTGANAVWASRKYWGHQVLPPNIMDEVKHQFQMHRKV